MKKTDAYVGSTDLFKVNPRKIIVRPGWNPRTRFDVEELKESIRDNGFYNHKPVLLSRKDTELYLVDGERRLRATLELMDEGLEILAIPAVLETSRDEGELLARALASNINAAALDPIEEAHAFNRLKCFGWELRRIAAKIGKSISYVSGRLTMLEAEPEVHQAIAEKQITVSDGLRVVQESNRTSTPQKELLEKKVKARVEKKTTPRPETLAVMQGGASSDEDTLVRLVKGHGLPWIIATLREMDIASTAIIDEVCAYDER
jgi:ParB/RepB/Spo0J family partition protein